MASISARIVFFAVVCLLSTESATTFSVETKYACENTGLSISCPSGYVIQVLSGLYGRTSNQICARGPRRTLSCSSSRAQGIIETKCNGKRVCSVRSSNSVFGDPCVGTFKYMTVRYRCRIEADDAETKHACENTGLSISCPSGYYIQVLSGFYGRTSNQICARGPRRTLSCSSSRALGIIETKCNGKRSCSVRSSNSVFGDPCVGTFKYTTVRYRCNGYGWS